MTTHVLNNNMIGANIWYDLTAGDALILLPNVSFISWSDIYDTGIFGVAGAGGVSVTIAGTLSVEFIHLYGGDRLVNTATATMILESLDGVHLTTDLALGQTRFVNAGSLYSGMGAMARGVTVELAGAMTAEGQAVSILNTGLIEARGIGVRLSGATNGAQASGQVENDGTISGTIAVEASGAADVILNTGVMTASGQAVVRLFGADTGSFAPTVDNTGTLTYTGRIGASVQNAALSVSRGASLDATVDIVNSGTIDGRGRAIYLDLDSATVENSGTISGAIKSMGGTVTVSNIDGLIRGAITLGGGADTLINAGTIRGGIDMGGGDDLLDLRGGRVIGTLGASGGTDNDSYYIDNTAAHIVEAAEAGTDTVFSAASFRLRQNIENLTLLEGADLNGSGNNLDNVITGNTGENRLKGAVGNDMLYGNSGDDTLEGGVGNDQLYGGQGDDVLIGGFGIDQLHGGAGADRFVFARGHSVKEAPDTILDFSRGEDLIDLTLIDANVTNMLADDGFVFIGSANFTGVAGQLRFGIAGGETFIRGDVNGDGFTDFNIKLAASVALTASDFLL
ncbi:M10 family metallopeptidase C-terminal domain-containing protein [Rhodobacter sp. KR11]|uniref:M10 family metallopeptidase C-terminal domain-containing protein n=1 Tax=Rhodobacter sp. KR11 TaxID=2974588 RepID=UPI0022232A1F|nr:M10 family metallopeptidase C-terminal domain-containing protein [Rhodobacter sp. KR11]MCW1917999.1 M10 family metallopeptidase C-terminal domain-containing protein [Rhodobacter sp. KR11]